MKSICALALLLAVAVTPVSADTLLTGTVTARGQKLEGVVVSAQMVNNSIITSVYTDDLGDYFFPKLPEGSYRVWAQTGGYLPSRVNVQLSGSVKRQDLALAAITGGPEEIGKTLTGPEWLLSLPAATPADKRAKEIFRDSCTGCHDAGTALQNRFDQHGWEVIIDLMNHTTGHGGITAGNGNLPFASAHKSELAAYLAKVRGPGSVLEPKFRPRLTGDSNLAVVREYLIPAPDFSSGGNDLPVGLANGSDWSEGHYSQMNGGRELHDATPDQLGNIWFTNSQENHQRTYGKVNVKTGKVTLFKIPSKNGFAAGAHAIDRDPEGYIWFNVSDYSGPEGEGLDGLGRVDPKTDKLELFIPPKGFPANIGGFINTDHQNGVWASAGAGMARFDTKTHEFRYYKYLHGAGPYGVTADANGNGWGSQISNELMARGDVETGLSSEVKVPPPPRAAAVKALFSEDDIKEFEKYGSRSYIAGIPWYNAPRRPGADQNPGGNAVYAPGWWGGTLMKIDIYNYNVTQYLIPAPELDGAYDVKVDKDHMAWVAFQNGDMIARFDPKAEKWTEFRLPTLNFDQHAIGLLNDSDGHTKITIPSFATGKVMYFELRTKQEQDALRAEARGGATR